MTRRKKSEYTTPVFFCFSNSVLSPMDNFMSSFVLSRCGACVCQKSRAFAGEPVDPTVVPKHCEIVSKSDVLCLLAAATRQMGPSLLRQLRWCAFTGSAQFGKNKRAALRLFCRRSSSQRMCMWYFLDAFPAGHNIINFSGFVDVDIETYDTSKKKKGIHSSRIFPFFPEAFLDSWLALCFEPSRALRF